jgi:ribonuclease P protein component
MRGVPTDASGSVPDAGALPDPVIAVERLKRRADFRAATAGLRSSGRGFALQARQRADQGPVRVGFTVSKQVGNAVQRNRVRRRLREIVKLTPTGSLHAGHDYVLVGRRASLDLTFGEMRRELDMALGRIHARGPGTKHGGTGGARERPLHEAGPPASSRRQSRPIPRDA